MRKNWFDTDAEGLRQLVEHKGRFFVIAELWQNAVDEASTVVEITLESSGHGKARLTVKDDNPDGFKDISHAFTLFAPSTKKADPEKRGRFNLGEKLVLALCDEAQIISVNHGVKFNMDGTRTTTRERTTTGTIFSATIRMTKPQIEEITSQVHTLIPPAGIKTLYNGVQIITREPLKVLSATLPTVLADDEGALRPTARKTNVEVYAVNHWETPMIYEMGIPVVESQTPYHINVMQKVPLNQERDNVTPAYYRQLVTAVVETMRDSLTQEETANTWVNIALANPDLDPAATRDIITKRFGDKVVSFSMTDTEANHRATMNGYTVLSGNAISREAWANVRTAQAVAPAHALFPTPKPYSDDPNAPLVEVIPENEWTAGMRTFARFVQKMHKKIFGPALSVRFVKAKNFAACYTRNGAEMDVSYTRLGKKFFEQWQDESLDGALALIQHEFAHYYGSSHLSEEFMRGLEKVGAKMTILALRDPALFKVPVVA